MGEIAIDITGMSKRYSLSHRSRPDSLKAWLRGLASSGTASSTTDEEFWALNDINLQVRNGECLALVGRNGSGKSTLLKILSRIIPPTKGRALVRGRMAALLEVGTGFHPELTGRENIFLNAAMLGIPEAQTLKRFDDIVNFSGVEKFLDTPVKHYSSGMYVRLAYAVAAHTDATILLIDEVLAVGDAEFQQRCRTHLAEQLRSGRAGIVVSHDLGMLQQFATHVAWLEGGRLVANGSIGDGILDRYGAAAPRASPR